MNMIKLNEVIRYAIEHTRFGTWNIAKQNDIKGIINIFNEGKSVIPNNPFMKPLRDYLNGSSTDIKTASDRLFILIECTVYGD